MHYESCVEAVCAIKDDAAAVSNVVCQSIHQFADACTKVGEQYTDWRTATFCPMPCSDNRVFRPRGPACPATCEEPEAPTTCKLPPKEGCFCIDGYVLNQGSCIRKEDCAISVSLDVILVVESSKLLGEANFSCVRDVLADTLSSFVVKKDALQAAFIAVGGKAELALPFDSAEERDDLARKLRKISFVGGVSDLAVALKLARNVLAKRIDDRPIAKAQKMLILHVANSIDDNDVVQGEIKEFLRMRTKIVTIGRGDDNKPSVNWSKARHVILVKPGCESQVGIPEKLVPTIEKEAGCDAGYYYAEAGACADVDECDAKICPNGADCINLPGSFQCKCKDGFVFDELKGCLEINECFHRPCIEGATCKNIPGSYVCECEDGYNYDEEHGCRDIDECAENNKICLGAKCNNTRGSYQCLCDREQLYVDKIGCQDKDPCSEKPCKCGANCKATGPTQFNCTCPVGQKYDTNLGCQVYDMCKEDKPCKANSTCIVEIGGYKCACAPNFLYDVTEGCKAIDFCLRNPCKGSSTCLPKIGGFDCNCKPPKVYNDSIGCQDPLFVTTREQIVFIGENTKEIGNGNFDSMKLLFKRLLTDLAAGHEHVNFGLITAGDQPTVHIEQASAPKEQILSRIDGIKFNDAKEFNLEASLRMVKDVNFKETLDQGRRIIVIVSADTFDQKKKLLNAATIAKQLRDEKVEIFYMGMGAQVSAEKAAQIVGRDERVYIVKFPVEVIKMAKDVAENVRAYLTCPGGYVRKGTKCILTSAIEFACEDANTGTRYADGERWSKNCVVYQCSTSGPVIKNTECPTASGECVPLGSERFQCKDSQGNFRDRCQCKGKPGSPGEIVVEYLRSLDEPKVVMTKKGGKCEFPFVYGGQLYYDCTRANHDKPWCSMTSNYDLDKQFGECKLHTGKITCTFEGKTYQEGESWQVGCKTYKCEEDIGIRIYAKCENSKGECIAPNSKEFQCKIKDQIFDDCSCQVASEGHVEYFVKEKEEVQLQKNPGGDVVAVSFCKIPGSDKQYRNGETWVANCTTLQCTGSKPQPFIVKKKECQNDNEECQAPSKDKFTCVYDGKTHPDCLCTAHDNGAVTYDFTDDNGLQQSLEMVVGVTLDAACTDAATKQTYAKGQKWISDCSVVQCSGDAREKVIVIERRCKTSDGACVALGSLDFPCTVADTAYKSCSCHGGPDNKILYKSNDQTTDAGTCEDTQTKLSHAVGETWTRDCVTFQCNGPTAEVAVVKRECTTLNGTCLPIGSSGFECMLVTKQVVKDCSCRLVDGSIFYTSSHAVQKLDSVKRRRRNSRIAQVVQP